MLDLDTRWELHPRVALRPESFGALLYHFGTRKLSFLKNPQILEIVRSLPKPVPNETPKGDGSQPFFAQAVQQSAALLRHLGGKLRSRLLPYHLIDACFRCGRILERVQR